MPAEHSGCGSAPISRGSLQPDPEVSLARTAGGKFRTGLPSGKLVVRLRMELLSLRTAPQRLSQSSGCNRRARPEPVETMMRWLILAGTALALAAGVTASAMASDYKTDRNGSHVGRFHTGTSGRTHHVRRGSRLAGGRGPEAWYPGGGSPGYQGGFIDLGPLGITAACGSYPPKYGHCGPAYGTPIDAWSY
jgi:hypothetical protein